MKTKFIFITGGVVSSLGKGISAASIGVLLKKHGLKVFMQKMDPYLNYDPGTMSPYQHGEVFVTEDGAETDLDLGHYERFIDENLTKESSVTAGKIYKSVIDKERKGNYLGATVQVVPHITNEIKSRIEQAAIKSNADVVITEIGGTVGDIESLPFIEAIREFRLEKGYENVLFVHNTLVPYLKTSEELKTKPTQHSVKELQGFGIQPDIIILRSEKHISDSQKEKVSMFCNVPKNAVYECVDEKIVYDVILSYHKQNVDGFILDRMNIEHTNEISLSDWEGIISNIKASDKDVCIALVGKYVELHDAYLSVAEALKHAGFAAKTKVNIKWIDATNLTKESLSENFSDVNGIIVPGGFGSRGTEGIINAIQYARENKLPFLGICFGMQLATIEFARNVLKIEDANSSELEETCKNPIIDYLPDQYQGISLGGTMRLGAYKCKIIEDSLAYSLYQNDMVSERHRHRYEFNNKYLPLFEKNKDALFSGVNPETNLKEIFEIKNHPFFISCQFHPEFKSRPIKPHPLFVGLINAAIKEKYE
jgi:CTP synthase